jgi:hypothetical protein
MKKLLLALFTCAGLLTSSVTSAQMAAGTLAPDFTGTDLNGNTWNLYTLLDSGKTVFIDVSATSSHFTIRMALREPTRLWFYL